MQFLWTAFIPWTVMFSHNCVQFFTKEGLSQVRNLKWLVNKSERLISKPIFFYFQGSHVKIGSLGSVGKHLCVSLAGWKAVLMMEKVAT